MKTLAVIPSRYEPRRLRALVSTILAETDVLILDNGHSPPLRAKAPVIVEDARGLGIYAMWNRGRAYAREHGYRNVAILNDDIRILPGTIALMARALRSKRAAGVVYPDWTAKLSDGLPPDKRPHTTHTAGTRSVNGMTGYCFMLKGELQLPAFDEGFHWWFGDDAFEKGVRRLGFTVNRIDELPIEHESDSEANDWPRRPELRDLAEQDRARWERLSA